MSDNVLAAVLRELERAFEPLISAADSSYGREKLLGDLGWDAAIVLTGDLETAIRSIGPIVKTVTDLADGNLDDFGQLLDAVQAIGNLINALDSLGQAVDSGALAAVIQPVVMGELAEDLLAYLVATYLVHYHPWIYLGGVAVTLVDPAAPPRAEIVLADGMVVRRAVERRALRFDHIPKLFEDPVGHLKQFHFNGAVDAAGAKYFSDRVLAEVAQVLALHDFDATYGFPSALAAELGMDPGVPFLERMLSLGFRFPPLAIDEATAAVIELEIGGGVLGSDEGGPAVVLIPAGSVEVAHTISDWTITVGLSGGAGGLAFGPAGVTMAPGSGGPSGRIELGVAKGGGSSTEPAVLIGGNEGTRIELGGLRFEAGVDLDASGAKFDLLAAIEHCQIVVAAGDGDGFLQHILPPNGFRVPFEFGVGFVSPDRLYFFGGAGLDIELPVDIDLFGIIKIPVIGLRVGVMLPAGQPPKVHAAVTANIIVDIGPFFATVEGMGLGFDLTFPPSGGNLGPTQVDLAFEPPRGVGLRIQAGPVTGGGYLFLDFANREYAGVLQIKAGPFGLTAVGLVTTRMPDGSDGFSMMLIISADFPPINLGYNFTFNGAGGMLGVNRTVDVPALQDGVRRGALDSILFPKDAVANAKRIITDVGLIFPPCADQFVVGPMVKLGWGNPPMISLAVGIVLEFPRFTISILGLIQVGLPTLEAPVVLLRVGIAGIVDPGRGEVSIDGTLFGSFVTAFSISGDFAVRVRWKGETLVAVSIGGFHPRFEPPAGFPKLNRLAIALADSDNPRIRLETYIAITPAAFMFGALLDFYVSVDFSPVGLFEVTAGLGFDTLIRFSPLSLEVNIYGFANLKRNGANLFSIDVSMRLTGPSPWHAVGSATINFFGEHKVAFELKAGEAAPEPPPPAIDLAAGVRAAFDDVASWAALPPGDAPVQLRTPTPPKGVMLVHPAAELVLRQGVAPLDRDLAKAGEAPIAGDRRIHIDGVLVGPDATATLVPAGPAVTDQFSPAQFFELTDDQRITGPQFEVLPSGVFVNPTATAWGPTATLTAEVESIDIDADDRTVAVARPLLFVDLVVVDAVAAHDGLASKGWGVLGVGLKAAEWATASTTSATPTGLVADAPRYSTWIDAVTSHDDGDTVALAGVGLAGSSRIAVPAAEATA